jgi:hypothetical protein
VFLHLLEPRIGTALAVLETARRTKPPWHSPWLQQARRRQLRYLDPVGNGLGPSAVITELVPVIPMD